jgi:TolB-like protein
VLPFTNMGSDPEQEYFADGLAEDLITDLSKVPGLLVIARNSSFTYKGRSVDIRSVARELGVRYVIEGSVRRAAARIRINAQLIDATDSSHVWADRFDRDLADIFALQDEVVGRIINALADALPSARPIASRRATNLEAYDLFARGRVLVTQSVEGNRAARPLLERSIEIDPGFAEAHAWLAMSHHFAWAYWGEATERHPALALAAAQRAVSLDPEDAVAHAILADVLIFAGSPEKGAAELATALRINPNHADAWTFLGQLRAFEGRAVEGIDYVRKALRLNPYPPGWYYWLLGLAQYAAGQYEDAVDTLRHESTHRMGSQRILAASLAQLGRIKEAKREAGQFLASHPHFSMQHWADTQPFRHEADRQHFIDGYVKAGLPR